MAVSPVKFLFGFLILSIILWIVFMFASRLLAWFLSRVMGATVKFRVDGWKCLRDIDIKFKKGAVESVSVAEIRLSLRQSLVKLGVGFFSKEPKVQVLISDLEVVVRSSKKSSQKSKSRRSSTSSRGKWMVISMARFLSVSVTELSVKVPKANIEIKELRVDISKDIEPKKALFVKLHVLPIVVHLGETETLSDQLSSSNDDGFTSTGQASCSVTERASASFCCEEFSLLSEFGHDREVGVVIKNLDVTSGDVSLNLDEELFSRKKSSPDPSSLPTEVEDAILDSSTTSEKPQEKEKAALSMSKCTSIIPEKLSFSLPKLDVKFVHKGLDLVVENNIMGIQVNGIKSLSVEGVDRCTRLDIQMEFSEIHLVREASVSVLEVLKLAAVSTSYIPLQPILPIRSEVDVKLGGTCCNIIMSRIHPWFQLQSSKKKSMVLQTGHSHPEKAQSAKPKMILWTCTVSAPEMAIVLYTMKGSPLYHGCLQSSHVFANNISSTGISVHVELGEVNLLMADEYQECLKESLFGVETNTGSLMHIDKVGLDWGKEEADSPEEEVLKSKLVLSVDVTSMGIFLTLKRVESIISAAMSFKSLLKNGSTSKRRPQQTRGHSSKASGKGVQLLKFNLERCSVNFSGDVGLDNTIIPDPKHVNYGSQGGQVIVSVLADGTPRSAHIMSTLSEDWKKMKYCICLDIFHFSLCMNKERQSTQVELKRAQSVYQEDMEDKPGTKVSLLDIQNAKFVHRTGGIKEIDKCSLFSSSVITVRWEPDLHIALFELFLRVKLCIHNQKLQGLNEHPVEEETSNGIGNEQKIQGSLESVNVDKKVKKRESLFAIDVEVLSISAEIGDGVEAAVQMQSIFSENASIGVLLEGLILRLNEVMIFKSSRMQVSRIPNISRAPSAARLEMATSWDWIIQGLDFHICMPYRLHLRAIDDAVEDMLRALKLISAVKTKLVLPVKKESLKVKKHAYRTGCVKFSVRKLNFEIEEEPLQGWLDEHYQLMKNVVSETVVRLKFLDDIVSRGSNSSGNGETKDSNHDGKILHNGEEINLQDASAMLKIKEEIYRQSFRTYYSACQNLVPSEGSGACRQGFQAGFKSSTSRTSLFSITATELDVSLTRIEGGDAGMIEVIQKLDPVSREYNIPFSRLYGSKILLHTGTLVVQIRNYTHPLLSGISGKCEGRIVLAQQATPFQPQITQDVFLGRWRKVRMCRSATGTTPPIKTYSDLPIHFQKAEISFGVGFEPSFADISYAFTVALRRANLSVRNPNASDVQPLKKERSLPWWDDMRNYIHGKITLFMSESRWNVLATTDPYEKSEKLQIVSGHMEIHQSDGRVYCSAKDFEILLSSLEVLLKNCGLKLSTNRPFSFITSPSFALEVTMDWDCDSGNPMNHYLFALPNEGVPREKVFDPFRSTSLSLRWDFSLRPISSSCENQSKPSAMGKSAVFDGAKADDRSTDLPVMVLGAHDLTWFFKFWSMNYVPPHKLRSFSRWPRFGVPRVARSGNLSLDKVMTEFTFRIDAAPTLIRNMPLDDDDPAKGLTFKMAKLKYELFYSRGKQKYTYETKRDPLDLVYRGLDLHMPRAYISKEDCTSIAKLIQMKRRSSKSMDSSCEKSSSASNHSVKHRDDGFLLSSDYFTIRRQAPKADPATLLDWQESGRRNPEVTYVRSEFENGSESDEHTRSDPSDDDGYNVVIADNCQRIFVYGLKLLWTLKNRDAVWSWVSGMSKAFESPKASPSRQYAQRKLLENNQVPSKPETSADDKCNNPVNNQVSSSTSQPRDVAGSLCSPQRAVNLEIAPFGKVSKDGSNDSEEEGTHHFMVNIVEPQFNLHSEDANGRFLLAAVSGRVLARSFHSVLQVGYDVIEQALGTGSIHVPDNQPEMTWNRMEFSVMLEHVQAHVAPTDVDPGAGLQWLPTIRRSSPKVKRTGALLERVFMPCDMYFRYTRHKAGTADLKMKPLKELTFNSHNITATMTSRQFQVMLDVLTNLLFARLPKPRKSKLLCPADEDEDVEEEADEVVPDGVEEVELAKIELEKKEREQKLLLDDIRKLSVYGDTIVNACLEDEANLWVITCGRLALVHSLKKELVHAKQLRKAASASLRMTLQNAAQLRLMEKEKNKSPSCAMRISMQMNKIVWSMLADGKCFAEAEINDMIYDFDRDYQDFGVARFTTKYFVVRNCLPNAKFDMILSPWDPPPEWGKKLMLRVDAKQGAPKDGNSPIESFQVEIYPLRIHLTETLYHMIWEYLFPEEEQDSQRRQDIWKVSTTAGLKRVKKGSSSQEVSISSSQTTKDLETSSKTNCGSSQPSLHADSNQGGKLQNLKANTISSSTFEHRRTSSLDGSWEESLAESVADELVLEAHSSSRKCGNVGTEQPEESTKSKSKEAKAVKAGRYSHEEKKVAKTQEDKRSRPRKMRDFHNIRISQVELLVTYEGPPLSVTELRLLMDTFHRVDFTGTWRKLFSRVKKHVIWGVLKSVTGMQGKKFKDKAHGQREMGVAGVPNSDLNLSDSDGGSAGKSGGQYPITWSKRPGDGAGDGFVTSIRGLFNSQRRKARAFVLRTMRGEAENEFNGDWSESDSELSPFPRQLTITKATKKLIRRHARKFRSRQKGSSSQQRESIASSPRETTIDSDYSSGSSPYEDFHE